MACSVRGHTKECGFFVFSLSLVLKFVHHNFEDYYQGSFCPAQVQHGKSLFIFPKAFLPVSLKHLYFDFKIDYACCSKALHTCWHLHLPTAKCKSVPSQ